MKKNKKNGAGYEAKQGNLARRYIPLRGLAIFFTFEKVKQKNV